MKLNFFIAFILCFLSPLAFSDSYSKGYYQCDSFEKAEKDYKTYPNSVFSGIEYATCLILRGNDDEGLNILDNIVKRHKHVQAAFILASYIRTGGTFKNTIDESNINKAIDAYQKVLSFIIDEGTKYASKYGTAIYEAENQAELKTYYRIPLLFEARFIEGVNGSHNQYLLHSPSYTGNRNLNTYKEYSSDTIDSLRKIIQSADRCLALPKKRHFRTEKYQKFKAACQVLKNEALDFLPLEQKRLRFLAKKTCGGDLPNCSEYKKVIKAIVAVLKKSDLDMKAIWGRESVTLTSAK